jgi:hypothetical protein
VHHIFPFHYCIALGRPDLELDDRNLITLCEDEQGKRSRVEAPARGTPELLRQAHLDFTPD